MAGVARPNRRRGKGSAPRSGGLSHREIGELLGISHARVQQIEQKALAKLRAFLGQR